MSPDATKPVFSLSGLSIEDDTFTGRKSAENELTPHMLDSHARRVSRKGSWIGATKSVKVPAEFAAKIEAMARDAAENLGYGARIEFVTLEDAKLERYSVGGKPKPVLGDDGKPKMKDGKPVTRLAGGTPALRLKSNGKRHEGIVKVKFAAAPAREKKMAGQPIEAPATVSENGVTPAGQEAPALVP